MPHALWITPESDGLSGRGAPSRNRARRARAPHRASRRAQPLTRAFANRAPTRPTRVESAPRPPLYKAGAGARTSPLPTFRGSQ